MAWCRLDDTFCDDPKWDSIAEELGCSAAEAAGSVALLYSWAVRHAPDGVLEGVTPRGLARVCRFDGDPMRFVHALKSYEVLNDGESLEIHGYSQRSESFHRARQKRTQRLKHRQSADATQTVARQSLTTATTRPRRDTDTAQTVAEMSTTERRGEENRRDHDLQISDPDPEVIYNSEDLPDLARQQKTPRGAGGLQRAIAKAEPEHTPTHQVRLRYEALWSQKFGRAYVGWSAKHARHAANVSKSAAALEETFALLEIFFQWNDPRVASAYSFCDGAFSFALQRDALRARLAKPDHERMVGIIGAARNQSNNQDAEKMQRERALDQFVDRFAREVTESERAASVSIGQQNPVKHPVKQFLSASGGAS